MKNPLRRLSRTMAIASMRPPLSEQMRIRRGGVALGGKRVLITGASSGIGESAAERFAPEAAIVISVARGGDRPPSMR